MKFEDRDDVVRKVQKALGVVVDGIDGKSTWTAIVKALNIETIPTPIPVESTPSSSSTVSDKALS